VLVYTSIIFLLYFVLLLLAKHIENKESFTTLVRELAIDKSEKKEIKGKEVFLIPSYNEGEVIWKTIKTILDAWYKNILIVNDGSQDNTKDILWGFWDKIRVLHHLKNRGQWSALETGFEYIRRYGEVDYIITFDADGQHNLDDLEKFYTILDKDSDVQIVFGSRFSWKNSSNIPISRKFILKLAILFTFILSRIKLSDTHNGYRVFRKKLLNDLHITIDWMGHASEIIDIIASKKISFREVPVNIHYTKYSLQKWQRSSNAIGIALRFIWNKFFK